MLRTILILALAALPLLPAASPPVARADEGLGVQITTVDTSGFPNIRLVLTVTDREGLSLTDLKNQQVIVTVGARQIPVSLLEAIEDGGVRISSVLAIDISGSMAGAPLTAARNAAATFIGGLRGQDEVSVLTFAERVETVAGFTSDAGSARAAVEGINARGNTALYQAVFDAANAIKERQAERRVVVLLSDGADFGGVSGVSRQGSLEAARQAGIPFYAIGLGSEIDRGYLQELAGATSGRLFIAPSSAQLQSVFGEVAQQVRTQYVVNLNARSVPLQGDITARLTVEAHGDSGSAEFQFNIPFAIPQQLEPPAPAPEEGLPGWVPVLLLLVILAVFGYFVWRRFISRRLAARRFEEAPPPVFRPGSFGPAAPPDDGGAELARLVGPDGKPLSIGTGVVSIGPDSDTTYRLPVSSAEFGEGAVRIWAANGRFIIHDTSVRPRLKVNTKSLRWGVLTTGDKVEICGVRFIFEAGKSSIV